MVNQYCNIYRVFIQKTGLKMSQQPSGLNSNSRYIGLSAVSETSTPTHDDSPATAITPRKDQWWEYGSWSPLSLQNECRRGTQATRMERPECPLRPQCVQGKTGWADTAKGIFFQGETSRLWAFSQLQIQEKIHKADAYVCSRGSEKNALLMVKIRHCLSKRSVYPRQ